MSSLRTFAVILLPLTLLVGPVHAMSFQSPPQSATGGSQLADPDEDAERLTDQTQRHDRRAAHRTLNAGAMVAPRPDTSNAPPPLATRPW